MCIFFIFYYVFILDVDVMWCFGIVIGLFNLIGGFVLIIIGFEVWIVVLLVKLIVEIIRIWYYYNLCRYVVFYYWMCIVFVLSMIKILGFKCVKLRRI